MDYRELLLSGAQATVALFIIIDPIGVLPIFTGLVRDMSRVERERTLNLSVVVAIIILILFATVGKRVLLLFGVGLPELMIAGGVMLLILGLGEVFGFMAYLRTDSENLGIVPLACPLLAGPGAIITTMLFIQRGPFPVSYLVGFLSIVAAMFASWLVLHFSGPLTRVLGARGTLVLAKLMGVLVTAIGMHFVLQGIAEFWTTWRPSA